MSNEELKEKEDKFIKEYSYIVKELHLLKEKIVNNSKIRYDAIDSFLVDLEEKTLNDLKIKKLELDSYSEKENSILSISIKLLEDIEQCELKYNEVKDLLLNNKEEYNNELNKFNNLFNDCIFNIFIEEYLKELKLIGDLGYFDELLIEELIDLLKKYNSLIYKETDDEIKTSIFDNISNSINKCR